MSDATCTYRGGCGKPVEIKKWGLCDNHYRYMRQTGGIDTTLASVRAEGLRSRDCTFDRCGRPRRGKDYCRSHENQLKKGGPLRPIQPRRSRAGTCEGDDGKCGEEIVGDGLCRAHFYRRSKGLPLTEVKRRSASLAGTPCLSCLKYGDTRKSVSHDGQCSTHAQRRARGESDWDRKIKHKSPDGTISYSIGGYRLIGRTGGRSAYEHRVIAEQLLGRKLFKGENIHHRNANRADNRTDGPFVMERDGCLRSGNLEIWSTVQPSGAEIGPKLDWAAEMLDQYGQFHLEAIRRVAARSMAILGQLGTPQEQKAAAAFSRLLAAGTVPGPAAELASALF